MCACMEDGLAGDPPLCDVDPFSEKYPQPQPADRRESLCFFGPASRALSVNVPYLSVNVPYLSVICPLMLHLSVICPLMFVICPLMGVLGMTVCLRDLLCNHALP